MARQFSEAQIRSGTVRSAVAMADKAESGNDCKTGAETQTDELVCVEVKGNALPVVMAACETLIANMVYDNFVMDISHLKRRLLEETLTLLAIIDAKEVYGLFVLEHIQTRHGEGYGVYAMAGIDGLFTNHRHKCLELLEQFTVDSWGLGSVLMFVGRQAWHKLIEDKPYQRRPATVFWRVL